MIRAPAWIEEPPGRYLLYFAHHMGRQIQLATADQVTGPWRLWPGGSLRLEDSGFPTEPPGLADLHPRARRIVEAGFDDLYPHVASPDVHVLEEAREIRMYYHGRHHDGRQLTRVATSSDGLHFTAGDALLGPSYFRVFRYRSHWYALAMPGLMLRSAGGLRDFAPGPQLFDSDMRHSAVRVRGDCLDVWFTRVGEAPERIYHATVDLRPDWLEWRESEPREVLRPERDWEGADAPLEPSKRGAVLEHVNQLRDPCYFEDGGREYLLYAVAGEQGIGITEIT